MQRSNELEVLFITRRIKVIGTNLDPIYEAIVAENLRSISEALVDQKGQATTITRIEVINMD